MLIEIGRIRSAHGLKGYVKADAFAGAGRTISAQVQLLIGKNDGSCIPFRVESVKATVGSEVLLKLAGLDDADAANSLRGEFIFVDESALPELPDGSYYSFMLEGLEVRTEEGTNLGVVKKVESYPANDVLTVEATDGTELLIPAVKDIIRKVDVKARYISVEDRKGLR